MQRAAKGAEAETAAQRAAFSPLDRVSFSLDPGPLPSPPPPPADLTATAPVTDTAPASGPHPAPAPATNADAAAMYAFGRYLLLSAGATHALNLQGVWAEGRDATWSGDYHLNVNMQVRLLL